MNELVAGYCDVGATIHYHQDPANDHNGLAVTGGALAVSYLAARFAGAPAPSNCAVPRLPPSA